MGKHVMGAQNSKNFAIFVPLFITLIIVRGASGIAQTVAVVFEAFATTVFVHLAARFLWAPLLKKTGFWWSNLFLGSAIVAIGLAAAIAGTELGGLRGIWSLSAYVANAGLLFSWALATIRGVEDKKAPSQSSDPTLIRSRLLRARRRTLQYRGSYGRLPSIRL
jgi:hypothetical protein